MLMIIINRQMCMINLVTFGLFLSARWSSIHCRDDDGGHDCDADGNGDDVTNTADWCTVLEREKETER